MGKFKLGDRIRVRGDLHPYVSYGGVMFVESMKAYRGCSAIISGITKRGYNLQGLPKFTFTDEMLEILARESEELGKFHVGQNVRIKKDLVGWKNYGNCLFTGDMEPFRGQVYEVNEVQINTSGTVIYTLENNFWSWTGEMLERVESIKEEVESDMRREIGEEARMDIDRKARHEMEEMTREEFVTTLKEGSWGWGTRCKYCCPYDVGLGPKECPRDYKGRTCQECWLHAISKFKFKDEVDIKEIPKVEASWKDAEVDIKEISEPEESLMTLEYDKDLDAYFLKDRKFTLCFSKFGITAKHPADKYNEEIGKSIAYKRMMIKEGK